MILTLMGQGGVTALAILAPHHAAPAPVAPTVLSSPAAPPIVPVGESAPAVTGGVPASPVTSAASTTWGTTGTTIPPTLNPGGPEAAPTTCTAELVVLTGCKGSTPYAPGTGGTTTTQIECVVTQGPPGQAVTYSPGPPDAAGNCAVGTPEPVTVTAG
jgi:hypothetical protein